MPEIDKLSLRGIDSTVLDLSTRTSLRSLCYQHVHADLSLIPPSSIRSLVVSSYDLNIQKPSSSMGEPLSNLCEVNLDPVNNMDATDFGTLLRSSVPKLARLQIGCSTSQGFALELLRACLQVPFQQAGGTRGKGTRQFARLIELELRQCDVDDDALEMIAASCPRLEHLNVQTSPKLTGVGVVAVVRKPGDKLKMLDARNCPSVSGDAVRWAREQHVHVRCGHPDSKHGKKVRLDH